VIKEYEYIQYCVSSATNSIILDIQDEKDKWDTEVTEQRFEDSVMKNTSI